jgi:hypothetical protein
MLQPELLAKAKGTDRIMLAPKARDKIANIIVLETAVKHASTY